jgi:methanogenic corrinoid protein MtbC1/DNA-binding XRE family transcriptional regulator
MQLRLRKNIPESRIAWTPYLREYGRALHEGDAEAANRVIEELPVKDLALADIYKNLITPAMHEIGDSWCSGKIGVSQEHLASQIVLTQLDRLRSLYTSDARRSSYRVLISCIEGEQHFIAARMFADLCLEQGWAVDFLGPDTPVGEILQMVKQRRPQIFAFSVTMAQGVEAARSLLANLSALKHPPKVIFAGQAVSAGKNWPLVENAVVVATDMKEGIAQALRFQRADRPRTVLREYLLELGQRVRELRTQRGWTQEQLAEAARVTRVCIVAVEGGKQNVSMDIVVRMANARGIRPEGLLKNQD